MRDETPTARVPDLASQLEAFNADRRALLRGRPIDPEGAEELMPIQAAANAPRMGY